MAEPIESILTLNQDMEPYVIQSSATRTAFLSKSTKRNIRPCNLFTCPICMTYRRFGIEWWNT